MSFLFQHLLDRPEASSFEDCDPHLISDSVHSLLLSRRIWQSVFNSNAAHLCEFAVLCTWRKVLKAVHLCCQAEDKELNVMPGRWHVLLKEQGAEDLNGRIAEWIQKRL